MTQTPTDLRAALVQLREKWAQLSYRLAHNSEILADLDALLALDHPSGETGWQPIETAPKDGTPILCYFPRQSWWRNRETFIRSTRWVAGFCGGWAFQGDFCAEPTHWRPLPPPPVEPQ